MELEMQINRDPNCETSKNFEKILQENKELAQQNDNLITIIEKRELSEYVKSKPMTDASLIKEYKDAYPS
jgi:arsenate reductase-like glutaredoxin family protein